MQVPLKHNLICYICIQWKKQFKNLWLTVKLRENIPTGCAKYPESTTCLTGRRKRALAYLNLIKHEYDSVELANGHKHEYLKSHSIHIDFPSKLWSPPDKMNWIYGLILCGTWKVLCKVQSSLQNSHRFSLWRLTFEEGHWHMWPVCLEQFWTGFHVFFHVQASKLLNNPRDRKYVFLQARLCWRWNHKRLTSSFTQCIDSEKVN